MTSQPPSSSSTSTPPLSSLLSSLLFPPPPPPTPALPSASALQSAHTCIHGSLPPSGLGPSPTLSHILDDLCPGFNGSATSATYYGFVTGGVLPVAAAADRIVSAWDQNVQVHLPGQGVATAVEWRAGGLLCELLGVGERKGEGEEKGEVEGEGGRERGLDGGWRGRTFTTGATASNVLGLACGREAVLRWRSMRRKGKGMAGDGEGGGKGGDDGDDDSDGVGELGLLRACRLAGVEEFQVLTTMGHSSLSKAASIVGLGRSSVTDVGLASTPWKFDMQKLESLLARGGTASIVAVSCGEVNTGRYATSGWDEMRRLRELCDRYGAWLHVDGAFGLFARALPPGDEFALLREACEGIELADSITGDAHKCLNVPYDCGFFLTRSIQLITSVFKNPNAAYLSPSSSTDVENIPSPLNINIENSRRFRALPVYAVLVAHGRSGLAEIFARQVRLARLIAAFVDSHTGYELLPAASSTDTSTAMSRHPYAQTGIIVLFRAVDEAINADLATRINRSGKIMVSGTKWEGRPAVRIAVSTWMVEEQRDLKVVTGVLEEALL